VQDLVAINLAIVIPEGRVAVDTDSPEADAEVAAMIRGVRTATREARPGRGRVWLFQTEGRDRNLPSSFGNGVSGKIDILGPGAILIAPGSTHESGHRYRWEVAP
jgi:hypothetical protein